MAGRRLSGTTSTARPPAPTTTTTVPTTTTTVPTTTSDVVVARRDRRTVDGCSHLGRRPLSGGRIGDGVRVLLADREHQLSSIDPGTELCLHRATPPALGHAPMPDGTYTTLLHGDTCRLQRRGGVPAPSPTGPSTSNGTFTCVSRHHRNDLHGSRARGYTIVDRWDRARHDLDVPGVSATCPRNLTLR